MLLLSLLSVVAVVVVLSVVAVAVTVVVVVGVVVVGVVVAFVAAAVTALFTKFCVGAVHSKPVRSTCYLSVYPADRPLPRFTTNLLQ